MEIALQSDSKGILYEGYTKAFKQCIFEEGDVEGKNERYEFRCDYDLECCGRTCCIPQDATIPFWLMIILIVLAILLLLALMALLAYYCAKWYKSRPKKDANESASAGNKYSALRNNGDLIDEYAYQEQKYSTPNDIYSAYGRKYESGTGTGSRNGGYRNGIGSSHRGLDIERAGPDDGYRRRDYAVTQNYLRRPSNNVYDSDNEKFVPSPMQETTLMMPKPVQITQRSEDEISRASVAHHVEPAPLSPQRAHNAFYRPFVADDVDDKDMPPPLRGSISYHSVNELTQSQFGTIKTIEKPKDRTGRTSFLFYSQLPGPGTSSFNRQLAVPLFPTRMELFGWLKRVKPMGKKLFRVWTEPEDDLLDLIKYQKEATFSKCAVDSASLMRIINVIGALMASGKMQTAANFSTLIAEKCFGRPTDNPYRLMFLSVAMIAECEAKFYDLSFFRLSPKEQTLKIQYSICQQSTAGFLEMEPTIFKICDLLTMCEEFSHFACFRQCHVNLLKNLAQIREDENVDWFDRVKVLDSNILALINDSDASRLCETDKEKKEFYQNIKKTRFSEKNNQFCFSWFNHLHLREICVRSAAAIEILKMDPAYVNFVKSLSDSGNRPMQTDSRGKSNKPRRRLQPRNPLKEAEDKAKRVSFGEDSGVIADSNMLVVKKPVEPNRRVRRRLVSKQAYASDVDDSNYSIPLKDGMSFSDLNAEKMKDKAYFRRECIRQYDAGGTLPIDPQKRLPSDVRRKIRMIVRKMMSEARDIQKAPVIDEENLNKAYPVSDDECSDDEAVAKTFFRTETLELINKKNSRKFGRLNPRSEAKHVVWWQNAKDELMTARAIANHCVKITGESSEPFNKFEEYMGKVEIGGSSRNRMTESNRQADVRPFDLAREMKTDDGALLTMSPVDPFKGLNTVPRKERRSVDLRSLTLQDMRRKCIDELLILMMIIKGQQQLQDGNVIRCVAYLMLIEFKLAVWAEMSESNSDFIYKNHFNPYLMHLYKCLLAKFRLYATDLFGRLALNTSEALLVFAEKEKYGLNEKCYEFCRQTGAYFFCICIRGRTIEVNIDNVTDKKPNVTWKRDDVEKQHEFFFGLDNASKSGHLNTFWRTECMPILSGFIHMTHKDLLEKIDRMRSLDTDEMIDNAPELTRETRNWLKIASIHGFLTQTPKTGSVKFQDKLRNYVPMLFQYPSKLNPELNTKHMTKFQNLEHVYEATTEFVRQKYNAWKEACKADKENLRKTNRDCAYRQDGDLTFYGEAIEKDVYMVAAYKGEHLTVESEPIILGMRSLCRQIRSQAGFLSIKQVRVTKDG
ncbi:unnamed protein product [Caenorhabditis sp. 36 PRJEB53466]|nr:unnamed protein product [Caenorhabditis sp. 36 PRJEB53466]